MVDSKGAPSSGAMFVPGDMISAFSKKAIPLTGQAFHPHSAFNAVDAVIMMVDDELLNIEMTQAFLEDAGYRNFVSTHESEHAIRLMREKRPHVLLLDLSMPKVSGMDILTRLRDDEQLRLIPVIVLTSNTDASSKLGALALGAMDFLSKPVDPSELALRLRNTLAARAHRDYLEQHDALTGLRNRLRYKSDVDAALATAVQRGHGAALLHIGVDRLAHVNDALGRAAGDALLHRMGKRLRQAVEAADLGPMMDEQASVYRFDGDEFAVLVPYMDEIEAAAGLISTLMDAGALRLKAGDREVFVTSSIGISVFPGDGRAADELISNAGVALRQAKQAGRNTYEFFSQKQSEQAVSKLRIGGDLRRALGRDELTVLYQPKVELRTGNVVGAETILRWAHPSGKILVGDAVMQAAGTSEMTMVLGEWLMENITAQANLWKGAGLQAMPIGVNISLRQFPLPQLMEIVSLALRSGVSPEWLCLELHELSATPSPELAARALMKLRELGVRVALDNFGTAESTLSHLKAGLMVNELKLDPSFMQGVDEKKGPAPAIFQSILSVARAMRLSLVATGIDSMHQFAFLKSVDADLYQGQLPGAPVSAADFAGRYLSGKLNLVD